MHLPSIVRGWLNTNVNPDIVFAKYLATRERVYLESLVKQFNEPLYHYLLTQSDIHLAEDILQSTWLKLMNSSTNWQTGYSVKSYLFTIARNTLIDELRKIKRWQLVDIEVVPPLTTDSEFTESNRCKLKVFNQTLTNLPFSQREAFVLQQEGFSLSEIANITGDAVETIKSRIRYARNTLKKNLEQLNEISNH